MIYKRGEIYWINRNVESIGHEQRAGRPAIIVSCDELNAHSSVREVVYLTTKPKASRKTHAVIVSSDKASTALCEQIQTVSIDSIGAYFGTCTADEMRSVDDALMRSLSIRPFRAIPDCEASAPMPDCEASAPMPDCEASAADERNKKIDRLIAERDV